MKQIPIYQVDAFTDQIFRGNPAAVCPLDEWLPDVTLQSIAAENNLAETAFFVTQGDRFHLRWFTPTQEVSLCGHATVATAHVLMQHQNHNASTIQFDSLSGPLSVTKEDSFYCLDFPIDDNTATTIDASLESCSSFKPIDAIQNERFIMLVYEDEETIANFQPVMEQIAFLPCSGLIITAQGKNVDFVSRMFAPQSGIPEDPVTGSAHCTLIPYWANKLHKKELIARQISERGGFLKCTLKNDRVIIRGEAITYLVGEIYI